MEAVARLLDEVVTLAPALGLREAAPLLHELTPHMRESVERLICAAPRVAEHPEFETIARADGWSLELFRWPRGARTPIHDHTSWGIYVCVAGQLGEERYARLEDGSRSGVARLRSEWRSVWLPGEQSTLLPYDGGIHRVHNAGLSTAVSLHLYGPRMSEIDGRDYDAQRDFVCDRALAA